MSSTDDAPESVEEAGALLGAAITKCNVTQHNSISPPKGMHSSFATLNPVPSSELFSRLYQLRALLRNTPRARPLVASPSLLAVLMKLLGVSSSLAARFVTDCRVTTPPLWSTPLRRLWVDCVVQCHVLGENLVGKSRIDIFAFVRNMVALAGLNPKSAKAAGGTRMAALQVIGGLFKELPVKLAPWALDVVQLCHRCLKSSGNGEPSYRIAAVRTACDVAVACRDAHLKTKKGMVHPLLLKGAVEDGAIIETVRLLRSAAADKYPEVREAAANMAALVSPMLILTAPPKVGDAQSNPTNSLDDVISLAVRNLDDEQAGVAVEWAEALSRLLSSSIVYGEELKSSSDSTSRRRADDDEEVGSRDDVKHKSRKTASVARTCQSLPEAVNYLVKHFVKAGGELSASRMGGSFSSGGRAVRIGWSLALTKLLRLQSALGNIGEEYTTSKVIRDVLNMVGHDLEKHLKVPDASKQIEALDATSASSLVSHDGTNRFSLNRSRSDADGGLARLATSRVFREGLTEVASEPTQLKMLQELIALCTTGSPLNSHQKQVALIEISHLLASLGEAAGSSLGDLVPNLQACLADPDHGVRHEAAIACASMAAPFPMEARKLFRKVVNDVQFQHAELVTLASMEPAEKGSPRKGNRFLRKEDRHVDKSLAHQYAIHGYSLLLAIMLRELPQLPGGLPAEMLEMALSAAEIFVNCQYMPLLTSNNPSGACTCVRAGYGIVCGALTVGPEAIAPQVALLFGLWQQSGDSILKGTENFTLDHDLICFDAALSSIIAFLEHCSELLLAVPDALSRTTLLLEKVLPLFLPGGRLGTTPANPAAASRYESAKASLMEAFAWLPPGSFPMVANEVFTFALAHIKSGTEAEVTCSILPTLVNNEDKILDMKSLSRSQQFWQVGGSRDIAENLVALNSEIAHPSERESVLHYQTSIHRYRDDRNDLHGSQVLGLWAFDGEECPPPTPLHEVGTWKQPVAPSCSSKVRLLDAAVQAFSATFGMKDGKEQQGAMVLLESLIPPVLAQLARAIGVDTKLTETDRRSKTKEDNAAIANITAVLLACLKALPLHEATHDIPIGLGPPWMNNAKDLLLTLLPSTSNIVRRAAGEGLALLATLGVTEDAHTLQSAVLHSLDEVMQGNKPDGKPRAIPLMESVAAARAGSLLTLACIQRTAHNIEKVHQARRGGRSTRSEGTRDDASGALPTIQMMTRILPSVACHAAIRDAFVVRTYAMHAFALLISYSSTLTKAELSIEDKHLLKKAVEMVEANFLSCWTAVSAAMDHGQEPGKLAAEASFVCVLLRTMTFLIPNVGSIDSADMDIGACFSRIASIILEELGSHPVVATEAFAFFETLSDHRDVLTCSAENALLSSVSFITECVNPDRPQLHALERWNHRALSTSQSLRYAVLCIKLLSVSKIIDSWDDELPQVLYALLEDVAGSRTCGCETVYRSLAVTREADIANASRVVLECEIVESLDTILFQATKESSRADLIRWVLFARALLLGAAETTSDLDDELDSSHTRESVIRAAQNRARSDASKTFDCANPCRWQVRCQAARNATSALQGISKEATGEEVPDFDPLLADKLCSAACRELTRSSAGEPPTYLVFHLPEILSSASGASVATVDQFELRRVQEGGVRFLTELISCFGGARDLQDPNVCLLEQYSSQILSSIKNALGGADGPDEILSYSLFLFGCIALETALAKGLIHDPMVFKRMVRPVIPSEGELLFCEFGASKDALCVVVGEDSFVDQTTLLLPRVAKLSIVARIQILIDCGVLKERVSGFFLEATRPQRCQLGIHSAAVAIDGALVLKDAGLSLSGNGKLKKPKSGDEDDGEVIETSGLLFSNLRDVDTTVKAALVDAWAPCAAYAAVALTEVSKDEEVEPDRREASTIWLKKLVPILLEGVHDSTAAFGPASSETPVQWARNLVPAETISFCLHGLGALLTSGLLGEAMDELAGVVSTVSQAIVLPALGLGVEGAKDTLAPQNTTLIGEACGFLDKVASVALPGAVETVLLLALLTPLNALQTGELTLSGSSFSLVITAYLNIAARLVSKDDPQDSLVNAMLQLALDVLSRTNETPESVRHASESLLAACFNTDAITDTKQQRIARDMAKQSKWDAWSLIASKSEEALVKSIDVARKALEDIEDSSRHIAALAAVRTVAQSLDIPSSMVGIIMQAVGAQVIGLFHAYGTLDPRIASSKDVQQHRLAVCADCMKILMVSYNQLLATNDDDQLTAFMSVILESWIALIQYNGLPNQASPQPGADPTLGRMSAQAVVHVARTSPAAFKNSMAALPDDRSRAILEFAVRADMSGYAAVAAPAPEKKRLNLQSFKSK